MLAGTLVGNYAEFGPKGITVDISAGQCRLT